MAQNFYMPITLSNINRFSQFFHCQSQQRICSNINAKDPTTRHSCRYTTLWNVTQAGDDYDLSKLSLRLYIPHDQRWLSLTCGFQTARTKISSIMLFGTTLQQMVYQCWQFTTVLEHWVGQTIPAFGWSRHWSVASPAWVCRPASIKADTLNI